MPKTPLVVDCDTGVDDALAMLLLAGSPEIEMLGVGSVHGNVASMVAAENSRRVLEAAGLETVPVAVGAVRPLAQPPGIAVVHGEDGLGNTNMPPPRIRPTSEPAAHQIVRLAHSHAGRLAILATGPLTNLAIALLLEPGLPALIRRVTVMGGAVRTQGNMTPSAEFNVWQDPEAADMVFSAGWDLTLVPLDVSMKAILTGGDLRRLETDGGKVPAFASAILQHYLTAYQPYLGYRGCPVHDALAAAMMVDPSLGVFERAAVRVELRGSETRGQTIADLRSYRHLHPDERPAVDIAVNVDAPRFIGLFLERLGVR